MPRGSARSWVISIANTRWVGLCKANTPSGQPVARVSVERARTNTRMQRIHTRAHKQITWELMDSEVHPWYIQAHRAEVHETQKNY